MLNIPKRRGYSLVKKQKPSKIWRPKPKSKAARDHLRAIKALPCCARGCGVFGVSAHHIRTGKGLSQRASDFETIPLCYDHHQGKEGFHTLSRAEWQRRFGNELKLLAATQQAVAKILKTPPVVVPTKPMG